MNIFKLYATSAIFAIAAAYGQIDARVAHFSEFQNSWQKLVTSQPVIVIKFYLPGCPPCNQAARPFINLSNEFADKALFVEINGKEQRTVTGNLGISRFPYIVVIKDGKISSRMQGFREGELRQKIAALVS